MKTSKFIVKHFMLINCIFLPINKPVALWLGTDDLNQFLKFDSSCTCICCARFRCWDAHVPYTFSDDLPDCL